MGKKFLIKHNRPDCIGCAACAAVCPKFWEMKDDGFSSIIGGKTEENKWETLEIDEAELDCNMEAAESCPVNVIHIVDEESGKELI